MFFVTVSEGSGLGDSYAGSEGGTEPIYPRRHVCMLRVDIGRTGTSGTSLS